MKKYEKDNQVYTVQEGGELEIQLIADGFKEKKEEEKDSVSDPYSKMTADELEALLEERSIPLPEGKLTKKDLAALLEKGNEEE